MFRAFFLTISALFGIVNLANAQISSLAAHNAMEGQCFARVVMQEVTETYDVRMEVSPEKTRQNFIPAVYRTENIRVEIKQETRRFKTVPAVYETVTERVIVRAAREELATLPARYETVSERILVEPEKVVWKSGNGLYGRQTASGTDEAVAMPSGEILTGEVLCRVVEPAKYRTVTKTVMVEPARTEVRQIPAEYKTITKAVVKTPPQVVEEVIPAEYTTIPVRVMVSPDRFETETIPAVYETVQRERVVPRTQWEEVLCETNATRTKVAEIQRALTRAGYYTAPDGIFGPRTLAAMEAYQKDKALPAGYMTVETVRSLGINPYA